MYLDARGQWRWTLYAPNHKKLANSGEGYAVKDDCRHAIRLVASSSTAKVFQRRADQTPGN
ncbi:YegP family protein [Microvirga calopogonii]|uniref:YegP family protein n=1 Tax=Microvirga calopogonii TaxID=2078013 RepID=UPI003CCAB261